MIDLSQSQPAAVRIGGAILIRIDRWTARRLTLKIKRPAWLPVARESLAPPSPGHHD